MDTLLDVAAHVRRGTAVRAAEGWPPGVPAKVRLRVPDFGNLTLPKHLDAFGPWLWDDSCGANLPFDGDAGHAARAALLIAPAFLAPLPTDERLVAAGVDSTKLGKAQNPVHVLAAVAVEDDGAVRYGIGRTLVLENARGFGGSEIVAHDERWFEVYEEFADALACDVQESKTLRHVPEGTATAWTSVLMLLNDQALETALPDGWKRAFGLVAGLYGVELDIHANAWNAQRDVIRRLKHKPPDALLVADGSIKVPDAFLAPYREARPDGYSEVLGSLEAVEFTEQILEVGMHLRVLIELQVANKQEEPDPKDWKNCSDRIKRLAGDHFVLTERATKMLTAANPYPDPMRMFRHVEALERLALKYHERAGALGRSLEDEAVTGTYSIQIALFDGSITPNQIQSHDHQYAALPHVKVDDYKSPDKVGRIYFAIDNRKHLFIVDHIGLHDYP